MAGINSVALTGRLTKDVELRKTQSDLSFIRFTIAVDRAKKDDGADFIQCTAWRQSAEYLANYAEKGTMIGVAGHIKTGSYDDKITGKKVYTTEVECDRVTILESKKAKADYPSSGTSYTMAEAGAHANEGFTVDSDDLPF